MDFKLASYQRSTIPSSPFAAVRLAAPSATTSSQQPESQGSVLHFTDCAREATGTRGREEGAGNE